MKKISNFIKNYKFLIIILCLLLLVLGMIIYTSVTKYTVDSSKNKEQELFFLISHGLMHLLGFDHHSEEEYNFVIAEQRRALESIEYDKI